MLSTTKDKILVVDDEPMICKSCKEILEEEGYRVDLAHSGQEGVAKALEKVFDLLIVDMKMPDLSGMALLKRIKGERLRTPVVMITAYSTVETAIEAMKLGASDYIPKPFTPDELSEVVKAVIAREGEMAPRLPANSCSLALGHFPWSGTNLLCSHFAWVRTRMSHLKYETACS